MRMAESKVSWSGEVAAPPRVLREDQDGKLGPACVVVPLIAPAREGGGDRAWAEVVIVAGEVGDEPTWQSRAAVEALTTLEVGDTAFGVGQWERFDADVQWADVVGERTGPGARGSVQVDRITAQVFGRGDYNGLEYERMGAEGQGLVLREEHVRDAFVVEDWQQALCPVGLVEEADFDQPVEGGPITMTAVQQVRPLVSGAETREALWTTPTHTYLPAWQVQQQVARSQVDQAAEAMNRGELGVSTLSVPGTDGVSR